MKIPNRNVVRLLVIFWCFAAAILLFSRRTKWSSDRAHNGKHLDLLLWDPSIFHAGQTRGEGYNYTRTLIMGHLPTENVSWVTEELPDLDTKFYPVGTNDTTLPANKGHEAMVYLTYIIDNYYNLPDISLFFHPHQGALHNSPLHSYDTATMLKHISSPHIIRQGYFNARCQHNPGCPDWLHVDQNPSQYQLEKWEEQYLTTKVFRELFPHDPPIPKAISQPCCAQFAVSRERILRRPLSDYAHYRDWLLETKLPDSVSGRFLEYAWAYIFTGQFEWCPSPHICYCDGFGMCFEGQESYNAWEVLYEEHKAVSKKLEIIRQDTKLWAGEIAHLEIESERLFVKMDGMRTEAQKRGLYPKERARLCGRRYKPGDGF